MFFPHMQVLEAAKARPDVLVQVGLEYRYIPAVAELLSQVKQNALGRVRMVAIREHRFPFLVKVNNWNRFNKNTGGTLVEKCCHFFDLMTVIANSTPVRVMASGAQTVNHLDERYEGKVSTLIALCSLLALTFFKHNPTPTLLCVCVFVLFCFVLFSPFFPIVYFFSYILIDGY